MLYYNTYIYRHYLLFVHTHTSFPATLSSTFTSSSEKNKLLVGTATLQEERKKKRTFVDQNQKPEKKKEEKKIRQKGGRMGRYQTDTNGGKN